MPPAKQDHTGRTYGGWTVLGDAPDHTSPNGTVLRRVSARCLCGKEKIVDLRSLRNRHSRSCSRSCTSEMKRAKWEKPT